MPTVQFRSPRHGLAGAVAAGLAIVLFSAGTALASDHSKTRIKPKYTEPPVAEVESTNDVNVVETPEACTPGNVAVDGGFETTSPTTFVNPSWPSSSTAFGTPFCNAASCGTGGNPSTAAPRTGTFWSWLGGTTGVNAEVAQMNQSMTFPDATAQSVTLNFYLWIGAVNTPFTDTLVVQVDNVTQMTYSEPSVAESGYTLRSINLTSFANGASHNIKFLYNSPANGGTANFSVDDVSLDVVCAAPTAKDSIGLFNSSTDVFYLRNTNDAGVANITAQYGAAGDVGIKGDWNNDGTDTIGVYRPSTGTFLLKNTNSPGSADITVQFGPAGSNTIIPLAGDWNNDNTDTIGIYDTANGVIQLKNTNTGGAADITFTFGVGGVGIVPIVGDWNGDGTDSLALFNMSTGGLFVKNANADGPTDITLTYGVGGAGYLPLAGDWNNDNNDSIGLYNPVTNAVFLKNTIANGAADIAFTFGGGGASPLGGDWDNLP